MGSAATEEVGELLRRFRKKPLFDPELLPDQVDYGPEVVRNLIPHRPPVLFVDRVSGIDLRELRIAGERFMDPVDPVFSGHFPGHPIFPGTFQIEAVGQLGLCLHFFRSQGSSAPPSEPVALSVRATRVLGAYYGEPVPSGVRAVLVAQVLQVDSYFAAMVGQCLVDGKVASVSAGEVLFLEP
ncbi:MAG TPA: 3-hydroxyacyl-ACP dehydratase FabZ family protein [Spirochaetia bacterium]|nr:3-hydroxyacyl-ACP dehydratase FabZ family protein [Spirochaetia bacterium]